MNWQLIETAPCTGEQILAAFKGWDGEWVFLVTPAYGTGTKPPGFKEPTHWAYISPPDEKTG